MGASQSAPATVTRSIHALLTEGAPEDGEGFAALIANLIPRGYAITCEELFASLQPDEVRHLLREHPRSLARIIAYCVSVMEEVCAHALVPETDAHTHALNAVRLLTRVLPVVLEGGEESEFARRLFWEGSGFLPAAAAAAAAAGAAAPAADATGAKESCAWEPLVRKLPSAPANEEEDAAAEGEGGAAKPEDFEEEQEEDGVLSLGQTLVNALVTMLFLPGLCVHPIQYTAYLHRKKLCMEQFKARESAKSEAAAAAAAAAALPPPPPPSGGPSAAAMASPPPPPPQPPVEFEAEPSSRNALWPSLLWCGGLAFPAIQSLPLSSSALRARIDCTRLVVVLLSGAMYAPSSPSKGGAPCAFSSALTGGDVPFGPTLFFSLLNTALAYDPVGFGIPYGARFSSPDAEDCAALALQAALLLLDYAPLVPATTTPAAPHAPSTGGGGEGVCSSSSSSSGGGGGGGALHKVQCVSPHAVQCYGAR